MITQYQWPEGQKQQRIYHEGCESLKPRSMLREQRWYSNGLPAVEVYQYKGVLWRLHGPAIKWWYPGSPDNPGKIAREEHYHNGQLHNAEGPAIKEYAMDGSLSHEEYFEYGKKLTRSQVYYRKTRNTFKGISQVPLPLAHDTPRDVHEEVDLLAQDMCFYDDSVICL